MAICRETVEEEAELGEVKKGPSRACSPHLTSPVPTDDFHWHVDVSCDPVGDLDTKFEDNDDLGGH